MSGEKKTPAKRWMAVFRFSDPRTLRVVPQNMSHPLSSFCRWKSEGQNANGWLTSLVRSLSVWKVCFDLQSCTFSHTIIFPAVQTSLVYYHQRLLRSFLPSPEYTKYQIAFILCNNVYSLKPTIARQVLNPAVWGIHGAVDRCPSKICVAAFFSESTSH